MMNKAEFQTIEKLNQTPKVLSVHDFQDKTPRTLLYGYTSNRFTWHVYLEEGTLDIVTLSYRDEKKNVCVIEENTDFLPDKRLYPEACDYEFCRLLKQQGLSLPFTNWDEKREEKRFYGTQRHEASVKKEDV